MKDHLDAHVDALSGDQLDFFVALAVTTLLAIIRNPAKAKKLHDVLKRIHDAIEQALPDVKGGSNVAA